MKDGPVESEASAKICEFLTWDTENQTVKLKPRHKYRTQINSQMALLGVKKGYFVVWTRMGVWYEVIDFDPKLWHDVYFHLEIFFQKFIQKHLLNVDSFTYCGICNKVLLLNDEINESEKVKEERISCTSCLISFHCKCHKDVGVVQTDNWQCHACELA